MWCYFLGPEARYLDRVPPAGPGKAGRRAPRFYNSRSFLLHRWRRCPDTIMSAVSRLGGKTILIRSPGEFAKAIERLGKRWPGRAVVTSRPCCGSQSPFVVCHPPRLCTPGPLNQDPTTQFDRYESVFLHLAAPGAGDSRQFFFTGPRRIYRPLSPTGTTNNFFPFFFCFFPSF